MNTRRQGEVLDAVLSPRLTMDAVTLRVRDLVRVAAYYEQGLGLDVLHEYEAEREVHRVLGRGSSPLIELVHTPQLPLAKPNEAGLFHTAFLYETQSELATAVAGMLRYEPSRYVGASDHLVSEAFYFSDPEGNGIEMYVDRPRSQWEYVGEELRMDNRQLDPVQYLQKHVEESPLGEQNTKVGHVHLQVGDLGVAREFYVQALGFEVTLSGFPGALFASAGGYHHHVAMNVWNSRGAGPRAAKLGLANVAVVLPTRADLDALADRLRSHKLQFADTGAAITVRDPWETQVSFSLSDLSK